MSVLRHPICLTTCFLLVMLFCGCSSHKKVEEPVMTSINIIDRNGFSETTSNPERLKQYKCVDFLKDQPYQKVLRIYSRDQEGNIRAYITSYHPNGHPRQYLEVVNNRAYGAYREWYSNGVQKLETFIIGGDADINTAAEQSWLFEGCSEAWDEDGHMIAQIQYANGVIEGMSIYYHANGAPWKRIPFHQGQMHGISEIYLENGSLLQTTEFYNGQKNGTAKRFWDNGKIASDELYCQGNLTTGRYYNLCGTLAGSVDNGTGYRVLFGKESLSEMHEYRQGVQEGEVKIFAADGVLARLYHVKNDLKHGAEIEYYPPKGSNGVLVPKISINWVEGRIQGITKTCYPTGIQESQREMNNNQKNGLLTAWYKDGSVMLIEDYDHDKLVKGEYYLRGEKLPISEIKNGKGTATIFDGDGNILRKVPYLNGKPNL